MQRRNLRRFCRFVIFLSAVPLLGASLAFAARAPQTSIRAATSGPNTLSGWEKREQDRKQREAELLRSNPTGDALTRALEELDRIYRDRKADPRPSGTRATSNAYEEKAAEYGIQAATTALAQGETAIQKDMELAPRRLSGNRLKAYLEGAEDTKSVMRGIRNFIGAAEYGTLAAEWFKAENDDEKLGALVEIEKELLTKIAQDEFKELAPKLFGPRLAAILLGPAAWGASIGLDVLTPTPTGRSYQEIIRDDRSKLTEKQEALGLAWKTYDKNKERWDFEMKRELWDLTGSVYRQQ